MMLFCFLYFCYPLKPFIHQCFIGFILNMKVSVSVIDCYSDHRIQSIKAALRGKIRQKMFSSGDRGSTTKNN